MNFQWIGGPTFVLEFGPFRLLSDPMFGEGDQAFLMTGHPSTGEERAFIERLAPLPPFDMETIDMLLISHLHTDHFDPAAVEKLSKELPVLTPAEQAAVVVERGFSNVRGLPWWKQIMLEKENATLKITAVPARHAHGDELNEEMGVVNGYLLDFACKDSRFKVLWTGDTVWFDGFEEIKEYAGKIDLLLPHIGAVGVDGPYGRLTLDAKETVRMMEFFKPDCTIPIHHHTFSHYVEPASVLQKEVCGTNMEKQLVILKEGECWKSNNPLAYSN